MEKFLTRAFGVVWIAMVVFLSFVIAKKPSELGMAIGFLLMSLSMAYCHFSGQFDPDPPTTAQPR